MRLFPVPRRSPGMPREMASTYAIRWMGRNALRYLREIEVGGKPQPTVDELTSWVMSICHHADVGPSDHFSLAKVAEDAATFALLTYDPEFYVRAAKGGRNSGRPRRLRLTEAQLASIEGLSHAQAAKKLACSRSTIQRIRRQQKAEREEQARLDAMTPDEKILDELDREIASRAEREVPVDVLFARIVAPYLEQYAEPYVFTLDGLEVTR